MYILRDYQQECLDAIIKHLIVASNALAVLPTGSGKGILNAKLVEHFVNKTPGMRIVCLVSSLELVEQNVKHIKSLGIDCSTYVGKTKEDLTANVVVGSIQSLYRHVSLFHQANVLIIDEVQDAELESIQYGNVLKNFRKGEKLIGLTATPYRLDSGVLMGPEKDKLFKSINYEATLTKLTQAEYLSPLVFRYGNKEISINTDKLVINKNRYTDKSITAYVDKFHLVERHAQLALDVLNQGYKKGLVFAANQSHALKLFNAATALGIKAEYVYSGMPAKSRKQIIADFKLGKYQLLINIQILVKGFDVEDIDFILFIRPTLSKGVFTQAIGRGTRLANGKEHCLVLDLVGAIDTHGLPYDPNYNQYTKDPDLKLPALVSTKTLKTLQKEEDIKHYKMTMEEYKLDYTKLARDYGNGTYIYVTSVYVRSTITKAGAPAVAIEIDAIDIRTSTKRELTLWFNVYHGNAIVKNLSRTSFMNLMSLTVDPFQVYSHREILLQDTQNKMNEAVFRKLVNRICRVTYKQNDYKQAFPILTKITV